MAESQCNVMPLVNSFFGKTSLSSAEFVALFEKYDTNSKFICLFVCLFVCVGCMIMGTKKVVLRG